LRDRFDIGVDLDAQLDAELAPEMRENVVRIAREAIANAARHGEAEHVSVSLTRSEQGVLLRVRDDGCGIARAVPSGTREGFGLRSVRERAAARGGHLILSQPADGGTELEVLLH
jgi:signal transduction histidine kinase